MCMVKSYEMYEIKTTYRTQIYDICSSYSPAHYKHSDSASSGIYQDCIWPIHAYVYIFIYSIFIFVDL